VELDAAVERFDRERARCGQRETGGCHCGE
jgi:hypothetical protein